MTLTGTTTPNQSGAGSYNNDEVLFTLRSPELEPHHEIQFSVIHRTLLSGVKLRIWSLCSGCRQNILSSVNCVLYKKKSFLLSSCKKTEKLKPHNNYYNMDYSISVRRLGIKSSKVHIEFLSREMFFRILILSHAMSGTSASILYFSIN